MEEIWLQREDESNDLYNRFVDYYLMQEKRTLLDSYNLYASDNNLPIATKTVPKAYRNIYYKYRWAERAKAYDKKAFSKYNPNQKAYIEQTISDVNSSIKTWRTLLKSIDELASENSLLPSINASKTLVYTYEKLAKARESLDITARRTLNLPTMINSEAIDVPEEDTDTKIEWNEVVTKEETEEAKQYIDQLLEDRKKRLEV